MNKDHVEPIFKAIYEYLNGERGKETLSSDEYEQLQRLFQKGVLSEKRLSKMCYTDNGELSDILDNGISQLLLQVTQSCNLTCSYCPYANVTAGTLQRNHTNRKMDLGLAKKAIDFLLAHSAYEEELTISFYGGEPLVNYPLIKNVVKYAKEAAIGKKLNFTMTTNGTLLTDEMIDFFVENSFQILFSIDGPAKIHDKNRRYADGSGSFEKAFANFKKVLDNESKKGTHFVAINMVFDPNNNLDDVLELFEDPVFDDNMFPVYAGIAEDVQLDRSIAVTNEYIEKMNYQYFLGYLDFLKLVDGIRVPSFVTSTIMSSEKVCSEIKSSSYELPDCGMPGGPCIPGVRRLFVTVDGTLYPCEKVNELSEAMKIGSLDTGLDIEKVRPLINIAQLTPESCKNCWAMLRCQLCAKMADDNGVLSGEYKNKFCYKTFNYMEDILRDYALFNECKTVYKRDDY